MPDDAQAQNLSCVEPLVFGEIITCGSAGTVTVNPDNSSSSTCVSVSGSVSRGRCVVTQSFPFRRIRVTVAASTVVNSGANNMSVTNFNIVSNGGGTTATSSAPFFDVPIGATLNVGATQAPGTYNGSLNVTAVLE